MIDIIIHPSLVESEQNIKKEMDLVVGDIESLTNEILKIKYNISVKSFPFRWRGRFIIPKVEGPAIIWMKGKSQAYTYKSKQIAVIHSSPERLENEGSWAKSGLLHELWHLAEAIYGCPWSNHQIGSAECFRRFGNVV